MISLKSFLLLSLLLLAAYACDESSDYQPAEDFEDPIPDLDNDFYKGETKCKHDELHHDPGFLHVEEEVTTNTEGDRMLASTSQIRMYPYYKILASSAPAAYTSYIQYQLAPPVISYFQAALQVKYRVTNGLNVPSVQKQLCGKNTPSILFGAGVAADFFIFYDSVYDGSGSWVAESYVCFMSTTSSRPLIATTKFNRALLVNAGGDVLLHEKNTYLLLHEMTHLLGFSTSLYPYFLDNNGRRRTGHIKSGQIDGSTSTIIATPVLTQRLRNFFGCSSLAGAYMENSGSAATAGSHFERRQFVFEYMSSGLLAQQRISQFTFALLEDSGWYWPNYNYAEPYYFGSGQGCGFLFNRCTNSNFNFAEFCKGNAASRGCSFQGRGGGTCQSDFRSDSCKYIMPNVNYDCENSQAYSYARLPGIQTFGRGTGSKCFEGTLATSSSSTTQTSFCFKSSCSGSGSNTVLNVQVGSKVVACRRQGNVSIPGYHGYFECPDPLYFCQTIGRSFCPRNCMGRGYCQSGKCVCYKGFKGTDCGLNY